MGNLLPVFHASMIFWLKSTTVTLMRGHIFAMTAMVGPPT